MPSRFDGRLDERGTLDVTQPWEVREGPWRIYLRTTGPTCAAGAKPKWETGKETELEPERLGPCRFRLSVAGEEERTVRLSATVDGKRLKPTERRIAVTDHLIVAIGDSVAAGEGVPERPSLLGSARWQSARCHRSGRAGVALAARQIEDNGGRSSVTFVHLACSGAEVPVGLLGPYAGAERPYSEPPLEPQIAVLERIAQRREVDAVLLSVGGNDVNFSGIATFCALVPADDCFAEPLPRKYGGNGTRTVRDSVRKSLREFRRHYDKLAKRLRKSVKPSRVYAVEYFDPTHDESGRTCEKIIASIGEGEAEQARTRILEPLNATIGAAAERHGWNLVDEVASNFRAHGYCAGDRRWVKTLLGSIRDLGGWAYRHRGTLHPNGPGQEVIGNLIAADLERNLYPERDFPARPFPAPLSESSGISTLAIVAIVVAAMLLGPALVAPALTLLPGLLLGALLALGWSSVSPLMIGLALGVLILVNPGGNRREAPATPAWVSPSETSTPLSDAAKPLTKLAKTGRPLLLPLLVVIAIGTVSWSPLVQFPVAAGLVVAAWKLIIAPEARKSGVTEWRRSLLREIGLHTAIALGLGGVVIVVARVAGFENPVFEALGDIASGLLGLAVLLWVVAILLRLFSFTTTRLRAVLALLLGLAILVLATGVGILPGADIVGDAWPEPAVYLGLAALALLAIDAGLSVAAGWRRRASLRRGQSPASPRGGGSAERNSLHRRAARAGLSTAGVAAAVLAVSTGWGLIDASERGRAENPPEEESADARKPGTPGNRQDDLDLARRYAPVLALTERERWGPESVDRYLEAATRSGPPGTGSKSIGKLGRCPEFGRKHCHRLSIECANGGEDCARGEHRKPGRLYRTGAVYVRVLKKDEPGRAEPRDAFARMGPFRNRLGVLIQYWYFYPYNEWRAPVFAGLLIQRHEADWEAVTIGLDETRSPLFVANSAHCAGNWRPWREIEVSTRLPGPRTHPLVAVAEGSHALYADAEESRAPDWGSCVGLPAGVTTAISYASNIRDRTEYSWFWYPPAEGWLEAAAHQAPMSFPGRWGADGEIVLRNLKVNPLEEAEPAPATPSLQPLWQEPVKTIFCGKYEPRRCERNDEQSRR
jgi:lysophospholipase L1-like esterase